MELPDSIPERIELIRVKPNLPSRLQAEWRLRRLASKEDIILCFGNLPPVFENPGLVYVFLQNRYLLQKRSFSELPLKLSARIIIERLWLRSFLRNAELVVQTPSMATETETALGKRPLVRPFATLVKETISSADGKLAYDLIYIASGEAHKNHRTLIEAWALLAQDGLRPSLALTLNPNSARPLLAWIKTMSKKHGLCVRNLGILDSKQLTELYGSATAMIYPSHFESFGLPLIEATNHNLPVLAPELDYVRDVCAPVETFDPNSAVSIARAVRRFLNKPDRCVNPMSPEKFLQSLLEF